MAKSRKHLNPQDRTRIVVLHEEGYSFRVIQEMMKKHKVAISLGGLHKIVKKHQETGTVCRRPGSGCPRKTTEREDRMLKRLAIKNRKTTAIKLCAIFETVTKRKVSSLHVPLEGG